MKNTKGILLIAGTSLVTFLVWYFAALEQTILPLDRARHIIAGLALNGLMLNFLLATRNRTLENWFGGLDKLYADHKYVGIGTLGLLLVHAAMNELLKTADVPSLRTASGGIALFTLVVLIGITLFARNLPYERWRHTHKFMLIPYVIGLMHTYLSSRVPLLEFSGVGIWTAGTALIGLWSAIFVIFFAEKEHFKYTGTVTNISRLSPKVIEWEITLKKPI
jgi:predicted ferric reductase